MSDTSFEFNFADGTLIDVDELARRRMKINTGSKHHWVISVMYDIDNPDEAMDSMSLGGDNFVGLTPIHCMVCLTEYEIHLRYHRCPLVILR